MGIPGVALNKRDIVEAIHKNKGVIMHACIDLNCSAQAIYEWMKRDDDVRKAVEEARADGDKEREDQDVTIRGKAYKSMIANLDKFDITATIFALKSKCKWAESDTKGQTVINQFIEKPYDVAKTDSDIKH